MLILYTTKSCLDPKILYSGANNPGGLALVVCHHKQCAISGPNAFQFVISKFGSQLYCMIRSLGSVHKTKTLRLVGTFIYI